MIPFTDGIYSVLEGITMKKICAITMVRNDNFFLKKWVEYYGNQLGRENLWIYFDGEDQIIPDFCNGLHAELKPRIEGKVVKGDKGRISFLSQKANSLMKNEAYDLVIGTDVDEFLVVDPAIGVGLREYLSTLDIKCSISGLGVDVGQHLNWESTIDVSRSFLSQRSYAYLCSRYTKASVIASSVRWGSGFHRVKGHGYTIDKNLFLFHFGSIDLGLIKARMANDDLLSRGWSRHLKKRARTIQIVTDSKPREWDRTIKGMRVAQQILRNPFAWNKPWNPITKVVVRIPDRFKDII